ncbi:cytochrome bo3 quinol oxidase subunit 2 [Paenacidovorax caeni]|uniref:Ubiquinol oxidase subunit 2 n=1 Tax=Paenacidovorax caeni TaxID=343013 RepID=A0A1I7IEV6_9BURK|nr:ubiquinol oxidase subunit II [Paenacidovorax caeni]SFU71448.1 cytochrome bo3 quinol oxidase subunit 2 [Paenacidovorax caeni]
MRKPKEPRRLAWPAAALAAAMALAGCSKAVVLNPAGDVAAQQGQLVITATLLMLVIIVPVIALTLFFAWKYRQGNTEAEYDPEWHHSTKLELVIWSVPLAIIIILGALTWVTTHKLDPYRPLDRIDAQRPVPAGLKPLEVQVVAMDWKWLFVYPEQGIALVNELAAPVDRPIHFKLTATSTMNAFYVPDLAGMVYAMPGMQTELHGVINKAGVFPGLASHNSGAGFSGMTFKFHGLSDAGFAQWVQQAQAEGKTLDKSTYLQLAKPSERDPVQRFARVDADLYDRVLNRCVEEGQVCMHEMMAMNDRARAALPADQCTPANAPQTIAALERPAASLAPQAEAAQ